MIFEFKYLGVIEHAKIELKGLTVITGLNDTGKSFISKAIYSVLKTVREAEIQYRNDKFLQIEPFLRSINSIYRFLPVKSANEYFSLRSELSARIFEGLPAIEIVKFLDAKKEEVKILIDQQVDLHKNLAQTLLPLFEQLEKEFAGARKIISGHQDEVIKFINYFDRAIIQQLFRGQINTLGSPHPLEIVCREGTEEIIRIEVVKNKVVRFEYKPELLFQDATLIDTPKIINLSFFIRQARVGLRFPQRNEDVSIPSYYLDLITKLPSLNPIPQDKIGTIYKEIEKIINGKVVYKSNADNYVYNTIIANKEQEIQINNIASGITSYGILQLLLNSGAINQKSVLIIDEPEVHLHPKWKLELARIIVLLSKFKIPIIISSHSPDLLEALATWVKKEGTEDITRFYFGKKSKSKGLTKFDPVIGDNLDPIFKAFSDPLQHLFFEA